MAARTTKRGTRAIKVDTKLSVDELRRLAAAVAEACDAAGNPLNTSAFIRGAVMAAVVRFENGTAPEFRE